MMISETDDSLRKRENRRLSIIDVSSADDSLLDPVSGNPLQHPSSENQEHADLLYTPNSKKFEDAASKLEEWEREPQPNETLETGKPKKNTKCNLRKSLAWDSAFFTSAGVLDPEELSSIIEGVERDEKPALPGIQEDVYKSCDSISTLESDSLTLESLETDLFEDIRASIQKSSNRSNLASGNSKVPSGAAGFQTGDSSEKDGVASCNKIKTPPAKNSRAGMQGLAKMTKNHPIFPQLPPKLVATRRESSISRQSKVPVKFSPCSTISSKRASLGNLHARSEKDKAKRIIGGRVSSVSKAAVVGGSRGTVPTPTPSSKFTSGPAASTKSKSATSTSSGSNLSGKIGKSPSNSLKSRVGAGNIQPPSSSSVVRTPSKIASRNKTESGNSSLSSLMSVTNLSSSISPASSISDWSSESSSNSMVKRRSNSSSTSLDCSSSSKVLSDTDAHQATDSQNPQSDLSLEGQETQHTGFINQCARTSSAGTVLPPAPMKPSGLRLPSPKIGFFDGVKSSGRTPRGGTQPRTDVPRGLPKHGAGSPREGPKLGKLQPCRSIMSTAAPANE